MSMCDSGSQNRQSGFTLIEMAMVMVILGLAAGGVIIGVPQYMQKQKIETTQVKFDVAMNALSAYAQRHNRLPCPANPSVAGANRGLENTINNEARHCFGNETGNNALYSSTEGVLPWRELGLSERDVMDGWGRYITYRPAPQLTIDSYSAAMLNDSSDDPDINNACRNQVWYDSQGNHINRQKALFCCNAEPKQAYLNAHDKADFSKIDAAGVWRQNAVTAAGATGATIGANDNVESTNAWIDSQRASTGKIDTPFAFSGKFGSAERDIADSPLIRASGHAVTLISYGGNGSYSFLRRSQGGRIQPAAISAEEAKNATTPETFAASVRHPKSAGSSYDPLGLIQGASDDVAEYLRSDQLYARAGSATCSRPICVGTRCAVCRGQNFGRTGFIIDTSKSMRRTSVVNTDTNETKSLFTLAKESILGKPEDTKDNFLEEYIKQEVKADNEPDDIFVSGLAWRPASPTTVCTGPVKPVEVCTRTCKRWNKPNCGTSSAEACSCDEWNPEEVCTIKNQKTDCTTTTVKAGPVSLTKEDAKLNYNPGAVAPAEPDYILGETPDGAVPPDVRGEKLITDMKDDQNRTYLFHTVLSMTNLLASGDAKEVGAEDEPALLVIISDGLDTSSEFDSKKEIRTVLSTWAGENNMYNNLAFKVSDEDIVAAFKTVVDAAGNPVYTKATDILKDSNGISVEEFFGRMLHYNYPNLRLSIVDVEGEDKLRGLSEATGGMYAYAQTDAMKAKIADVQYKDIVEQLKDITGCP